MTESTVEVDAKDGAFADYTHGDGMIRFHHCKTCGCVTHYTSVPGGTPEDRLAVNMRMAARADMERYPHRLFDGADTWEFLD